MGIGLLSAVCAAQNPIESPKMEPLLSPQVKYAKCALDKKKKNLNDLITKLQLFVILKIN